MSAPEDHQAPQMPQDGARPESGKVLLPPLASPILSPEGQQTPPIASPQQPPKSSRLSTKTQEILANSRKVNERLRKAASRPIPTEVDLEELFGDLSPPPKRQRKSRVSTIMVVETAPVGFSPTGEALALDENLVAAAPNQTVSAPSGPSTTPLAALALAPAPVPTPAPAPALPPAPAPKKKGKNSAAEFEYFVCVPYEEAAREIGDLPAAVADQLLRAFRRDCQRNPSRKDRFCRVFRNPATCEGKNECIANFAINRGTEPCRWKNGDDNFACDACIVAQRACIRIRVVDGNWGSYIVPLPEGERVSEEWTELGFWSK